MLNAFCLCLLVLSDIITAKAECSLSLTRWAMFPFINLFASLTGWYRVSMETDNCSRYQPKWWRLKERKGGKGRKNKHVTIDCRLELTVNTLNKHSSAHIQKQEWKQGVFTLESCYCDHCLSSSAFVTATKCRDNFTTL